MARYLITGITGFAAPHLANLLVKEGHEVWGLARDNRKESGIRDTLGPNYSSLRVLYGDLNREEDISNLLRDNEFDGVFHLAAQTNMPQALKDPRGTFETNTLGTIRIASALEKYQPKCRLLFSSSGAVYGRRPGNLDETLPLEPIEPYGVSKAAAEMYLEERVSSAGLDIVIARPFSHTGPRRAVNFSIASDAYQIVRIRKGLQEPEIKVGNLDAARAVMDVRDCVDAYRLIMQKSTAGQVYNIGANQVYSMGQLLDKMIEISGVKANIRPDPQLFRKVDVQVQIPDSTKLRSQLGWEPKIGIDQTLKDLLNHFERELT